MGEITRCEKDRETHFIFLFINEEAILYQPTSRLLQILLSDLLIYWTTLRFSYSISFCSFYLFLFVETIV